MICKLCGNDISEPVYPLHVKRCKQKAEIEVEAEEKEIDIEQYKKGGGWYEYKGETYRKNDLLELLGG